MKNYQDRAMRLAHRNGLIQALFFELTTHDGLAFTESYVFLETFFGIEERQIRKILRQKSKVELSSDNLTKLAVLLQRISEKLPKSTDY